MQMCVNLRFLKDEAKKDENMIHVLKRCIK